jgi:hypothetical protein
LFNKIVRDSVVKIKWDIEWFEEYEDEVEGDPSGGGEWVPSTARYYLQMINQILVEDSESTEPEVRSYIMLLADNNVKLLKNHSDKNQEDFYRLVREGIALSSDELKEKAKKYFASIARSPIKDVSTSPSNSAKNTDNKSHSPKNDDSSYREGASTGGSEISAIKKLAEASSLLRQNISVLAEEREAKKRKMFKYSKAFRSFAIEKDLLAANALFDEFSVLNLNKSNKEEMDSDDINAEEALHRAQKIEEGLENILSLDNDDIQSILEEIDLMRKTHKNMLKTLEIRDKEIMKLQKKLES